MLVYTLLNFGAHYNKLFPVTMVRNITLSADEQLIARARARADVAQTSLNVEFRKWLEAYASEQDVAAVARLRSVLAGLAHVDAGRSFTRDEMNER
jgi:hypothetical protein